MHILLTFKHPPRLQASCFALRVAGEVLQKMICLVDKIRVNALARLGGFKTKKLLNLVHVECLNMTLMS